VLFRSEKEKAGGICFDFVNNNVGSTSLILDEISNYL